MSGDRQDRAAADGSVTESLPRLLDAKGVQRELGVTRSVAEALMRRVPKVVFPGVRKTYVRRADVVELVEASTFTNDQVPV